MPPSFILLERQDAGSGMAPAAASGQPTHARLAGFFDLMSSRKLHAVYQPILDMHSGEYFAFEGLIRGPADSALHSPQALFDLARQAGLVCELEHLCREVVLTSYADLDLPGKLFINASVPCLQDTLFRSTGDAPLMESIGLTPSQVVIELTENHLVSDFAALHDTLADYRRFGYQIAIDDLGEGFSNLRMWSEVRPEFVKIDRHFISGIADDPLKFQLVRAMHEIAETCGTQLVAEGIETESEFITVRDLGIRFAQGFLIAKPMATPASTPTQRIHKLLDSARIIVYPRQGTNNAGLAPIRQLLRPLEPVSPNMDNDTVYARFEREPHLLTLPVVEAERPVGMINRHVLIDRFARPFRRELYGKKPCRMLMDGQPIMVDHTASVQDVARLIGSADQHSFSDGFIVTREGRYLGVGSSRELMGLITDMQIRSARHANPLTQLPGNVPINEHIERLLASETCFVACYADLDSFKPYNDVYGYRRGDEVILMLAQVLSEVIEPREDFLGHVGGDDFMLLFQSHDWEARCRHALSLFDSRIANMVEPEHLVASGFTAEDRRGQQVFHSLPALSLGCVPVATGSFHSQHDVASAVSDAKHQAKKTRGSSLFVERRRGT